MPANERARQQRRGRQPRARTSRETSVGRQRAIGHHRDDDHQPGHASAPADGAAVAMGGMLLENRAATLVRALLRFGAKGLFMCSAPDACGIGRRPCWARAGSTGVRIFTHISAGQAWAMAPQAAGGSRGQVRLRGLDEAILLGGYLRQPTRPLQVLRNLGRNGPGRRQKPLVIRYGDLVGVGRAAQVDVALLHAPSAIRRATWSRRQPVADLMIARARRHVDSPVITSCRQPCGPAGGCDPDTWSTSGGSAFGDHPNRRVGGYVADRDHIRPTRPRSRRRPGRLYRDLLRRRPIGYMDRFPARGGARGTRPARAG